jgi:hypothetical protein
MLNLRDKPAPIQAHLTAMTMAESPEVMRREETPACMGAARHTATGAGAHTAAAVVVVVDTAAEGITKENAFQS